MTVQRKLRFGQIGGGRESFIGATHRRAATFDGRVELVAGALSRTPQKARQSGTDLFLPVQRIHDNWQQMLEHELALPESERIDFVSIATPNHAHFAPALAFVENGFHVIVDKPMVTNSEEASALIAAVERHDVFFAVSYNYTGYPMVKQAQHIVQTGQLGEVQRVVVEYPQSWLREKIEAEGQKQALWRTDPVLSGKVGAVGDIGTHGENLMSFITGLKIESLCADLHTFVPGRQVDDDVSLLLRFAGGARGILWVSQVATGEENGLNIRVYGTTGGLRWRQDEPNLLHVQPAGKPDQVLRRGNPYLCPAAARATHIAAGLNEAFFEAFGNIYLNFTDTIRARLEDRSPSKLESDFPTVKDGARGVTFMEKVLESSRCENKWTAFPSSLSNGK